MTLQGNTAQERFYTVHAIAANYLLECFIGSRSFCESAARITFTEEHHHSSYELIICHADSGFQFVNGIAHRYETNSMFLLAPYANHANISDCEQNAPLLYERYSIRFELRDALRAQLPASPCLDAAFARLKEAGFFHLPADASAISFADRIAETIHADQPYAETLLGGFLSALFAYVFRAMCLEEDARGDGKRVAPIANDATRRKFLIDYYFDHLMYGGSETEKSMDALCRRLHLSQSQLNRVMKETYGTSFKKREIEVRLAYIKYYLKYADLTVAEISERAGFISDSAFSAFFKQHCGVAPTEYRRAERTTERNETRGI